jgi:hypothetical protein
MNFYNSPNFVAKPVILIAPLNWGLGHATRCIPIIHYLQKLDCKVVVAVADDLLPVLQAACPGAEMVKCPSYNIRYSKNTLFLPFALFLQIPGIILTIYKERRWLKKVVKNRKISAIISDNRFGFYHPALPTVYITHQLHIKTGNRFTNRLALLIHRYIINQFNYCWVPDFAHPTKNLAGQLSHGWSYHPPATYLGGLSRFSPMPQVAKKYDLLVVLSGPEPQRSIFENIVATQLAQTHLKTLLVRGVPQLAATVPQLPTNDFTTIHNHLESSLLNEAMAASRMVLCRSGYTSIMDLVKLKQPAILVPTPGQPEQEYLARHCMQQRLFYSTTQQHFNLLQALANAQQFTNKFMHLDMEQYKNVVQQFVETL